MSRLSSGPANFEGACYNINVHTFYNKLVDFSPWVGFKVRKEFSLLGFLSNAYGFIQVNEDLRIKRGLCNTRSHTHYTQFLRPEMEHGTRCTAASCPSTVPTVQSTSWFVVINYYYYCLYSPNLKYKKYIGHIKPTIPKNANRNQHHRTYQFTNN